MAVCPKCQSTVPARKLLGLSAFSRVFNCPTCGSKLRWRNIGMGRVIGGFGGGVGGGLGGLFGGLCLITGNITYFFLATSVILAVFFASWAALAKYAEFSVAA